MQQTLLHRENAAADYAAMPLLPHSVLGIRTVYAFSPVTYHRDAAYSCNCKPYTMPLVSEAENARFDGFRFMQRLQACQKEANLTGCRTGR